MLVIRLTPLYGVMENIIKALSPENALVRLILSCSTPTNHIWIYIMQLYLPRRLTQILKPAPLFVVAMVLSACATDARSYKTLPTSAPYTLATPSVELRTDSIVEASGLATSAQNPNWFWTHNDSGDEAQLFLLDGSSGKVVMNVKLDGAHHIDYEDITRTEQNGRSFLIVGDIGDNAGVRDGIQLYRIEEPLFKGSKQVTITPERIESMQLYYAEGARDAETLMSAPDGQVLIVSKREDHNYVYVFDFIPNASRTLNAKGRIPLHNITAGDINPDGDIALRDYQKIYLWRANGDSAATRLGDEPDHILLAASEPQGEAIAWTQTGELVTLSERMLVFAQQLHRYVPSAQSD